MDKQVGRLRNKLKDLGIADNTLVFYTSDNGPEGSSPLGRTQGLTNGLKGRKRSLYEGGIRVPGIIEWPSKINPGTLVKVPCFTSDYFPTIAHILGIDIEKYKRPYDGENLLPYWMGKSDKRSKPLAFQFNKQFALIDNDYKLYGKVQKPLQLYNLKYDGGELTDLSIAEPEKLKVLQTLYQQWDLTIQKSKAGIDY